MMMPLWWCSPGSGRQVKRGSSESATFMRKVPDPTLKPLTRRRNSGARSAGSISWSYSRRGPTLETTASADHLRAALQPHADRAAAVDQHARDRRLGDDLDARLLAGLAHRLRDRAHAADGVAPRALLAVHLAEDVVEQHIGRARRVGAGEIADHRVEAERGLDRLALEPAVEEGRARDLVKRSSTSRCWARPQAGEPPPLPRRGDQRRQPLAHIGRRSAAPDRAARRPPPRATRNRPAASRHRGRRICANSACVRSSPPPSLR